VKSRRVRAIERRLRNEYGFPRHHNPADPLDDLIFLVLSRMTQEVKYVRTYERIRSALPTWAAVCDAPAGELEELIGEAGLAPTKSRQIQAILHEVVEREGRLDLARLSNLSDSEAEEYLCSLPGVSRKTALCVLLYAFERDVLPVDAHVWRVSQRLGLAPEGAWSEQGGRELEERVEPRFRRSLHVTMISHGRSVCRASSPRCSECVVRTLCAFDRDRKAQEAPQTSEAKT
jgi:endonuclease III